MNYLDELQGLLMGFAGASRLQAIERIAAAASPLAGMPPQLAEALDTVAKGFQRSGYRLHRVVLPHEMRLVFDPPAPEHWRHPSVAGSMSLSFGPEYMLNAEAVREAGQLRDSVELGYIGWRLNASCRETLRLV